MKKLSESAFKKLVDELGQLDAEIAPLEDKKKKADELRAQVRAIYQSKSAEQAFTAEGHKFTATIGPMGNERRISSMRMVFASVGAPKFLENCTLTLKKLEELVSPAVVAEMVTTARTGTRPVKTFARSKP